MSIIFVIGAVGAMCTEATRDLIETGGNYEYMLADLILEKLKLLQNELGNDNVSIMKVDAGDFNAMREAIAGYDFVMNGLAFGRAQPSIRACMAAKIPTILLDDFPQDDYYEGLKNAGVLCAADCRITGSGTDDFLGNGSGREGQGLFQKR